MKALLALILSAASTLAVDVHLAWDASVSPGVTNYALSVRNGQSATVLNVGTNLTATAESLTPGQWEFKVACASDGVWSDWSTPLIVEIAGPPTRLRTVVLQYSGTLSNFYDVGFFKLRLP